MALQREDGLQLTRRYTYLRGSWEAINSPHGFADRYNIQRTYKHKKCLHKADNRPPLNMCNAANIPLISITPNKKLNILLFYPISSRYTTKWHTS